MYRVTAENADGTVNRWTFNTAHAASAAVTILRRRVGVVDAYFGKV